MGVRLGGSGGLVGGLQMECFSENDRPFMRPSPSPSLFARTRGGFLP